MEKKFKGTKNLKVLTVGGVVIGVGTDDEVSKVTCNSILPDTDEEYEKEREVIEADMNLYAAAPDLLEALQAAKSTICRLKLSMLAHPDCTEGSEFDDYTSTAQEVEDQIEEAINKALD